MQRSLSGADQLEAAVAGSAALLRSLAGLDWAGTRAAGLEWSCRATAEHIAGDLLGYAGQLAGRARDTYLPFELRIDPEATNSGVVEVIETAGALLAAAVRTTPPRVRAFHPAPFLAANRQGFAAMGIAEVLLHTHDIARGLGVVHQPAPELAEFTLQRIFPEVRPGLDPWETLLWATGRGELPGRAPVTSWRWHNSLVLPTERLTLESATPAVLAELCAGGDGGFAWLGDGPLDGTREAAGLVFSSYEKGVLRAEFGLFVLVRRADGLAIGSLGFHAAPDGEGRTEIGYDVVPEARGNGFATEAVRAVGAWALGREQGDVDSVFAVVAPNNLASKGVLERAGFVSVGQDVEGDAYELRRYRL
ncbi:GNAT family N-acetyltransferase [Streptomyces roseirectus]|uniref:GNAT family N-acetyltransferase n=1 Tax=Streptomyces roseirectus TaxID=2768066 RepID=A0A7H0IGQ7_9ACTN|nr:GNAT family N-acetyltransferase [Streptomyces roseirectus]QNP71973.1 GNAT family N-acetyltransferase [Streptomyces roseirectus]